MSRHFFISLLCLAAGTFSVLANATRDFEQANQQFQVGDFSDAAARYEKILAADGPRASVYYNLGNAYQSLKRYGPAILAYERARMLSPRDPDLLANLTRARKSAAAFEEKTHLIGLDSTLNYLSRNEWSWLLSIAAISIGILALIRGIRRPTKAGSRKAILLSAITAGALVLISSTALYLRRGEVEQGVVLTEDASVHLSPFENAESLGTAGQGRIAILHQVNGDFYYVELPGTTLRGWLSKREVEPIHSGSRSFPREN